MLYNNGAVLIGLVYTYLPFVVLPLFATLEKMDKSLLEAAADLGARPLEIMTRVVIPLCAPAFRAGAVLVFIPCLGAYLTPDLLGGGKTVMAGNLIQNQFTTARDWPFGSAVSLVLMAIVLVLLILGMRRPRRGPALREWPRTIVVRGDGFCLSAPAAACTGRVQLQRVSLHHLAGIFDALVSSCGPGSATRRSGMEQFVDRVGVNI